MTEYRTTDPRVKAAHDAGEATATRLLEHGKPFSARYVAMAVVQDALMAFLEPVIPTRTEDSTTPYVIRKAGSDHEFLCVDIDSGGMSVCWVRQNYATQFTGHADACHFAYGRLKERYPNAKVCVEEYKR